MAELYSILTTLPIKPSISPKVAQQLIKHNALDKFEVVYLSNEDYIAIIDHLTELGIVGGATYDALILYTALKVNIDQVITLNEKDFRRIYPTLASQIVSP